MKKLKAIETNYNGYRFRSRLEAKWAVFFDALKVKYQYELEGFDLGELGWYLPDFFLSEQDAWVEVKGKDPTQTEIDKIATLCLQSRQTTIILSSTPGIHAGNVTAFFRFQDTDSMPGGETPLDYLGNGVYAFGLTPIYGGVANFRQGRKDDRELWIVEQNHAYADCLNVIVRNKCRWPIINERLENAYSAARSARFEHSERNRRIRGYWPDGPVAHIG